MFPSTVLLFVASALFSTSNAADFAVKVGQGGLKFSPDHVSGAVVGDTVTFQFLPSDHTATQSTLATPCSPLAGGFDSGTRAGATTADAANTFKVTVNNTSPIWVYCHTAGHCPAGMVFAVNAVSDAQLAQFQQNAVHPGAASSSSSSVSSAASSSVSSAASSSVSSAASSSFLSVASSVSSSSSTRGASTTGGTSASPSGTASTSSGTRSTSSSAAQVVLGVLMTVLAGSFGALL